MTKADIAEQVHMRVGLMKKEAAMLVQDVLDEIRDALKRGEPVKISGFGSFVVVERKPRVGRNPKSGEEVPIPARQAVAFRASPVLKARINGEGE
ncbi:MAG: integration host factor subunit alpha [Zetaproteobacteria bacterium]|nr:MAG: integration host factor subunit alpha [Zetaproteobacteria bacterium]